jgi:hypothetical protein
VGRGSFQPDEDTTCSPQHRQLGGRRRGEPAARVETGVPAFPAILRNFLTSNANDAKISNRHRRRLLNISNSQRIKVYREFESTILVAPFLPARIHNPQKYPLSRTQFPPSTRISNRKTPAFKNPCCALKTHDITFSNRNNNPGVAVGNSHQKQANSPALRRTKRLHLACPEERRPEHHAGETHLRVHQGFGWGEFNPVTKPARSAYLSRRISREPLTLPRILIRASFFPPSFARSSRVLTAT